MTRTQQWWKRRAKYIARRKRYTNAKTRPRTNGGHTSNPFKGGHQDPKGVLAYGPQPRPRVKYKTYLKHRPTTPAYPGVGYFHIDGTGYADPPHYKITPTAWPNDRYHGDRALGPGANRTVGGLSRPLGRGKGGNVITFKAWTYWKYRKMWPDWDPLHRTPVDPGSVGIDDDWRP